MYICIALVILSCAILFFGYRVMRSTNEHLAHKMETQCLHRFDRFRKRWEERLDNDIDVRLARVNSLYELTIADTREALKQLKIMQDKLDNVSPAYKDYVEEYVALKIKKCQKHKNKAKPEEDRGEDRDKDE
jgi:hypothetical protein